MNIRAIRLVLATVFAIGLHTSPAQATSMVQLSTEQLVDASDAIVQGKIIQVWTEEDARGIVWTRAQVSVERTLKGDEDRQAWVIDQMGGNWGEHKTIVHGRARFSQGERAIFFLEKLGNGRVVPVGMQQGKLTLRMDPHSRDFMLVRFNPGEKKAYDHRFIPHPSEENRIYLSDFVQTIETRVASGWDGQPIPGSSELRLRRINHIAPQVK